MSPEVGRQVFDPFFTTRRDQGSTGLGLHIVHNIVTNRLGVLQRLATGDFKVKSGCFLKAVAENERKC